MMNPPRNPPRTEGELQRWCVKEFKALGYLVYKFASPACRGVPDLMLISPHGGVLFVEVKHPNGKSWLSPLQKVQIKRMVLNNSVVYVASSVDDCMYIANGTKARLTDADL